MPVGKLTIEVSVPHAQSLKDRRQVVRSLKDKLRNSFNCSVAELDKALIWNRATIGIACISGSAAYLKGQLEEIDKAVLRLVSGLGAEVLDSFAEMLESEAP